MKLFIDQHNENCRVCMETDEYDEREHAVSRAVAKANDIKKPIKIFVEDNLNDNRFFKYHAEFDVSTLNPKEIFDFIQSLDMAVQH